MSVPSRPILCAVPVRLREPADLERLIRCLVSLWGTAPEATSVAVTYGDSDPTLLTQLDALASEIGVTVERAGYVSRGEAANRLLAVALESGADVVLVNPDVEFSLGSWLPALHSRTEADGRFVGIVGARLLKENGTVHRAGYLFSRLTLDWHARLEWAPGDLPESLRPVRCPVGGGVELIRHETLVAAGLLDERMPQPLDGIDLSLRAYAAGLDVIYEPGAVARWTGHPTTTWPDKAASAEFDAQWHGTDLSPWVPAIL
jgi:hypothetical protein